MTNEGDMTRMKQMLSLLVAGAWGRSDVLRFFLNKHYVVIFHVKVPLNAATFTQMSSAMIQLKVVSSFVVVNG